MSLIELTDKELGKMLLDAARFSKSEVESGRILRCWLASTENAQSELEALRAEVSRTAAVVQAMLASRIAFTEETLEKERWMLDALRTLQVAIDPIFKTPQPTKETNT